MPRRDINTAVYKSTKEKHPTSPGLKVVGNKLAACHDVAFARSRAMRGGGKKLELRYLVLVYHEYLKDHEEN